MVSSTNILIVGQGAIGLLWYHHLVSLSSLSSNRALNISLLSSNQQRHLTEHYQFTPYNEDFPIQGKVTYAQKAHIAQADLIILCVKSYQTLSVMMGLKNEVKPNATFILAQNGMGVFEKLPKPFTKQHPILTMLITHGSLKIAPLCIKHTGIGACDIGLLSQQDNMLVNESIKHYCEILNSALPCVTFHQCIQAKQWLKLAVNCVINPITAIYDINNGQITQPKYQAKARAILTELLAVFKAEKVSCDLTEFTLNNLLDVIKGVAQATALNCSSMRSDIKANRPTEVDYINGYIHTLGKKHGIATPTNSELLKLVKAMGKIENQKVK